VFYLGLAAYILLLYLCCLDPATSTCYHFLWTMLLFVWNSCS